MTFEPFEERQLLAVGPQLISLEAENNELIGGGVALGRSPGELMFRFDDGQIIDPATLGGIEIAAAGADGTLGTVDDVPVMPGFMGIGQRPNEVVVRLNETLADDDYRVLLRGSGANPLANTAGDPFNDGVDLAIDFSLNLGARIVGVVPQPVSRDAFGGLLQARDQIDVYFNESLPADFGTNPGDAALFQLIFTAGTATTTDDSMPINPTSVSYDAAANRVSLLFSDDLANLGSGVARLRVGTSEAPLVAPTLFMPASDPGSTFASAEQLGTLDKTIVVSEQVASFDFPLSDLTLPGATSEPGHRELDEVVPGESHTPEGVQDFVPGISTFFYNFRSDYGSDPQTGEPLQNLITEEQKDRAREIFEFYSRLLGVQFVETEASGFTIATGDPRVLSPLAGSGPGGVGGIAGGGLAIMDAGENWGDSEFGGGWFQTAMHEIGHLLGLGHSYDLPPLTIMGDDASQSVDGILPEPVFPGDNDVLHGQLLHFNDNIDIDLYSFSVTSPGTFTAEIVAERLDDSSLLDSVLTLYDEDFNVIARNDDYFSEDSFIELELDTPGIYYVAVTSTGLTGLDPNIEDSGIGGTTQGEYDLRLGFRPEVAAADSLLDAEGTPIDGDGDGTPGGVFNFWFNVASQSDTLYVDKMSTGAGGTPGSLANPFDTIQDAIAAAQPGSGVSVIRVVGNGGTDSDLTTLDDNVAYEIGYDTNGMPLADGSTLDVPADVALMFEPGTIVKLRAANITAGSQTQGVDRGGAAVQVLGTPDAQVVFTSWFDETIGQDTTPDSTSPSAGDWGGLVFRNDIDRAAGTDLESEGIFLNFVAQADIRFGGGAVVVNSFSQVFTPLYMNEARPTLIYSRLSNNATAAMSADPNSFEETRFGDSTFAADYVRVGPAIYGNTLENNSINGLLVRTATPVISGELITNRVAARWDDYDIVHVLTENLLIEGTPGGPAIEPGASTATARLDGRLAIDPGVVVKLGGTRIEAEIGSQFIAEGQPGRNVVFTSLFDDSYGRGGTFDTGNDQGATSPAAGDWAGLFFGHLSQANLDYAEVAYAGGVTTIEGGFAQFNPIEIIQSDARITNTIVRDGADGQSDAVAQGLGLNRNGRGPNSPATIFVRGAQPILVDNTVRDNLGAAININVNSLKHTFRADTGRATGPINRYEQYDDNRGPLVRGNILVNNELNGMGVRGGVLTTQSVWDDVDIVHVVAQPIEVLNHHTFSGLRLESSPTESLVVKLVGDDAGFTAMGTPFEIDDRIGGTVQIVGYPDAPVVLTALSDDSAGAGTDLAGNLQTDTDNVAGVALPGAWDSVRFETFSNDRNVEIVNENELPRTAGGDFNGTPTDAQFLGTLAPDINSGDDNRRLGFEVNGFISLDDPGDVDVYSFNAEAGTDVWFDLDLTASSLDSVIELVDANGVVLARSVNSIDELNDPSLLDGLLPGNLARVMRRDVFGGEDFYTINPRDAGMRVVLPGPAGVTSTYFVRVRSNSGDLNNLHGGETRGAYKLQIRLRETDEVPGSAVRYADIRYATNGIEIIGAPLHSPLIGEAGLATLNNSFATAQDLGNLLASDRGTISAAGAITSPDDVNWYKFTLDFEGIQSIAGFNDFGKTYSTVFDIDYADGSGGPDTTISVFDENGTLILVAQDSNIADDLPRPEQGADTANQAAGSFGVLDAFLGSVQLPEGASRTYYVAVSSTAVLPSQLDQFFQANASNPLLRLEPITGYGRIAEDHIEADGVSTVDAPAADLFNGPDPASLNLHAVPFQLKDVNLFVNTQEELFAVDAFTGTIENEITIDVFPNVPPDNDIFGYRDIVMRDDGRLYGLTIGADDATSGNYTEISTADGSILSSSDDGIGTDADVGVQFEGLAYQGPKGNLFAVGNLPGAVGEGRNILFQLDSVDATTVFPNQNDPPDPTDTIDQGNIDTSIEDPSLIGIQVTAGNLVNDGDLVTITDTFGTATFEMDAGFVVAIPAGGASAISDGDSFTISFIDFNATPPVAETRTFTYDVAPLGIAAGPDEVIIPILPTWTADQVAAATEAAINQEIAALQLPTAVAIGGQVFIGGDDRHAVDVSGGPLTLSGTPGVTAGNEQVVYTPNDSATTIAQSLADAINQSISILVTADAFEDIVTLNTPGVVVDVSMSPFTTIAGRVDGGLVTGLAFLNSDLSTLFAVSDGGGVYRVNPFNANDTTLIAQYPGISFQGLTPGPENTFNGAAPGAYADLLFAVDNVGNLYALDTDGNMQTIFDSDGDGVADSTSVLLTHPDGTPLFNTILSPVLGLDFTPFDYSLWHVTGQRGDDPGHGVNTTFDGDFARFLPANGGQSFWFGLEDPRTNGSLPDQPGTSALIGTDRNEGLFGTYNLPGGTYGSLVTNTFSLEGYTQNDRPVLYFNYFLNTEDANSNSDEMRDSFRVFISDDGENWEQLGTNNSILSTLFTDAELPEFLSASERASFDSKQQIQELFDNTNSWRQARISLGNYAGLDNLRLRFDFSTAGAVDEEGLPGNEFGNLNSRERGQNNDFEGVYIDDVIIGFAERGEMATAATVGDSSTFVVPNDPTPDINPSLVGPYQLEIRRGTPYAVAAAISGTIPFITKSATFDTNERFANVFNMSAPAGNELLDGQTFFIDDGQRTVVFEFDLAGGVTPGNVAVPFSSSDSSVTVANTLAAAINGVDDFEVTAQTTGTDNRVELFSVADAGVDPPPAITPLSALDDYVNAVDPSFAWSVDSVINGADYTATVIDLTSQTWRTPAEVTPNVWQHWLQIVTPTGVPVNPDTVILAIGGGSNGGAPPTTVDQELVDTAIATGSIVVVLPTVPNQPLQFAGEPNPLSEDAAIAFTFEKFLDTGDPTWPLLLPMVKSAFAAMDATEQFLGNSDLKFIVTGGSKRGWTTWLTAAVDQGLPAAEQRVIGIAPAVFDFLNFNEQIQHHRAYYEGVTVGIIDGFSVALQDYVQRNLMDRFRTPDGQALLTIVDPYTYRDRLADIPKYLINSTGDEFFVPDSSQLYFDDLPGVKYLRYTPNTGHGLDDRALDNVASFYNAVVAGADLPEFTWNVIGNSAIVVQVDDAPLEVKLWQSTNPMNRDFRDAVGAASPWTSEVLSEVLPGVYVALVTPPDSGATAFTVELTYDNPAGGDPLVFTTDVVVTSPVVASQPVGLNISYVERRGDTNLPREPGQLFIQSNTITNAAEYGIRVAADQSSQTGTTHPGAVRILPELNNARLVPGITIENNVIAYGGLGGIEFGGNGDPADAAVSAVPFGRIVNNTLYGQVSPLGVGIDVKNNASPTLLNNIVANFTTGIQVDPSSASTVVGGTVYQNNTTNVVGTSLGSFPLDLGVSDPLFVSAATGDFNLQQGSQAIDSSIESLLERPELANVLSVLGILPSPIVAPDLDRFGRTREDDPATPPPPGLGANVFKDRGALERVVSTSQPTIQIDDVTIVEGNAGTTDAVFTVTAQGLVAGGPIVTVEYQTSDGTATAGTDYQSASGMLSLVPAPGETIAQMTIVVPVIGDTVDEDDETFFVDLSNAQGAVITKSRGQGTILDDDMPGGGGGTPMLSIGDVSITEGQQAATIVRVPVSLSQPVASIVSVNYATADDTATAGSDYTARVGTLLFQPGVVQQDILIQVLGDTVQEPTEMFTVTLSNAVGADILDAVGVVTILDDDSSSPLLLPDNPPPTSEGASLTYQVQANNPGGYPLVYSLGPSAPAGATIDPNTGLISWTPSDDAQQPVSIDVMLYVQGESAPADTGTVEVEVSNVAPEADLSGPDVTVPGYEATFTLWATDASLSDQAAGFTFDIDWDGDGTVDESVSGPNGMQVTHAFDLLGNFNVLVTATDKDGGVSTPASQQVNVTSWALLPDENDPSLMNLVYGGTDGLDAVFFFSGQPGEVFLVNVIYDSVFINTIERVTGVTGRVIADGKGSADILVADYLHTTTAELHGGEGDDVLFGSPGADRLDGGSGDDLLVGGTLANDGADVLLGGEGNDVLYGHLGADTLDGNGGEDLLIGGRLNVPDVYTALFDVTNEWRSSRDYASRVANLSGTGSGPHKNGDTYLQGGSTVIDDGAVDTLVGGSEMDWFIYSLFDDQLTDAEPGEEETSL